MKYAPWIVLFALAVALTAWGLAALVRGPGVFASRASAAEAPAKKAGGLPPLTVERNAPRLLDKAVVDQDKKAKGPVADNSACYVCHTNYQDEELAQVHAENDVGCVKCHGESLAHRNDENNTTPPDKMHPTDMIDLGCGSCHEDHDVPVRKVVTRFQERSAALAAPGQVVCTDCHGMHRLKLRSVRRDKKTGKLMSTNTAK